MKTFLLSGLIATMATDCATTRPPSAHTEKGHYRAAIEPDNAPTERPARRPRKPRGIISDHYAPMVHDAAYPGPVSVMRSSRFEADVESAISDGFQIIGTSGYVGDFPVVEHMQKVAEYAGANLVIFTILPFQPGVRAQFWTGPNNYGHTQRNDVRITFLGR